MLTGIATKIKKFNERRALIFFTCFIYSCAVFSQAPEDFFIQQLDNRNGLSNSSINNIYRDSDSILWVATWDGLNMYDGTSFHVFNYSKENNYKTIGSNVIQGIFEDHHKHIWISTIEGVSRYEKHSGKFQNYFYDQYPGSSISEQEYELAVNTNGKVYCLTSRYGLTRYNPATDTFEVCTLPHGNPRIVRICFDGSGRLWMLNNAGTLEAYGGDDTVFKPLKTFRENTAITHLFYTHGEVFYTTGGKLCRVDGATLTSRQVMETPHPVASMIWYDDHYLMAWSTKGYGVFDNGFKPSGYLWKETKQMQDIRVTSLAKGSEQILWLGTDGNGIIKIYPKTKSFGTVPASDNDNPYNKSVRAFCEENGNLWFGTKGNGIVRIKDFPAQGPAGRESFMAPQQLDNNSVYALLKGADDLVYIGTDGKGVGVYDISMKRFYRWQNIAGHEAFATFGSVYAMVQDADRSLWLGTSGYGLIHLQLSRDAAGHLAVAFVEQYAFNGTDTGPANDIIYALANDDSGRLWMGCRYGGLSVLDKRSRRFKTFKAFAYEGSLSNNDVLSVYIDSRNRIWAGTSYGLNWIDNRGASAGKPVFKKFTTANGLPNNTIHGITEDASGHIWASTNRGLVEVIPETGKISNYQQVDGLQSNEFCDGAVWKDRSGKLFFGGTHGFNFFLPQDIRHSEWLPNLLVSNITMGGKGSGGNSVDVLHPSKRSSLAYTVERKDNSFELDVRAVSFLNAEKCEYAYFMEGYDNSWHYPGTLGKIAYNNILPGNYALKIKWSNGEGVWTESATLLDLTVSQYFWLRWYALLAYALIALVILYIIYNYRKNKYEIKQQLAVEHAMRTREEELHRDRISFFTYIAHELQTPLTLIMGSIERFMDKPPMAKSGERRPYFLSLIHQQASKLAYLVHQLMEFRKTESGFFKKQYAWMNISELLVNLAEPFIPLSEVKQMGYDIHVAEGIKGWTDKDKLEKIIFNLLSNAFKHAECNEKIVFTAFENASALEITVANSGCRLSQEEVSRLFDKFYVAGTNTPGTEKFGAGIGLAFARQLAGLLDGTIEARREQNWISFHLHLPVGRVDGAENPPANGEPLSGKPSYLYQSITSHNHPALVSIVENNKQALIERLKESSRKSILIVEDDQEIRYLLNDILKEEYIISEASDGRKAIELMLQIVPDLIICDVMMPNMNGLEFCSRIKNTPATCHIPVIVLSARDTVEQHNEGYEVGADAYIAKPFHTGHLRIRVRKLLENAERLHNFFRNPESTRTLAEASLPESDREFLAGIITIIEENMDEPDFHAVTIEKKLSLSKMQLYRRLKTLTGMTPGEFIRHIRLRHAAHLLTTTRLTVAEIFHRTGFNNQSYFFREFKKRYQLAPNEYRAQQTIQI